MKILQPHKISSEIPDVVYEAKEYLIIVSPYVDLTHWKRLEAERHGTSSLPDGKQAPSLLHAVGEGRCGWRKPTK